MYGWFQGRGANGFGYNSTAEEVTDGMDLSGKTYLVTGCNSGLGQETVRVLALRRASVIGAARTEASARAALGGSGEAVACDLSEPDSVRRAVEAVRGLGVRLDGIVANAGIMALPERVVKHGLELQFLTNHMGHFLLVTGLLDQLTEQGRVVMLSSRAHLRAWPEGIRLDDLDASKEYQPWSAYGQSKLANLLFARHLATRLPAGQTAHSCHPGVIATNLTRNMNQTWLLRGFAAVGPALFLKSVPQGAATQTLLATHPSVPAQSGLYWADCNPTESSAPGRDDRLAEALWEQSEALAARL